LSIAGAEKINTSRVDLQLSEGPSHLLRNEIPDRSIKFLPFPGFQSGTSPLPAYFAISM
jgi:hypothetical protein